MTTSNENQKSVYLYPQLVVEKKEVKEKMTEETSPKTEATQDKELLRLKTGYNQHASPLDCTLSIVRRGNNRIISKVYIDRGG